MISQPEATAENSIEWRYVLIAIAAYVFAPELGRLIDWRVHLNSSGAFTVIPLVMLCPIAVLVFRKRRLLHHRGINFVLGMWAFGFGYSAFVAAAHGAILAAIYAGGQFCLPITIGLWLLTRSEDPEAAHARLIKALLIFGTVAGAYGLIQYIFAPPWDTAWMQSINAESFGTPERFGIRVFGPLNSPGTFALVVGAVIVLGLPFLRVGNLASVVPLLLMVLALLLSLVRTAWLAIFIGIAIYLCLSPNRKQAIGGITTILAVCILGLAALILALPNGGIGEKISERFSTLSNTQDDGSVKERRANGDAALERAFENAAGGGLGLLAGGGKLTDTDAKIFTGAPTNVIDNGFVARFFEMGVLGFAGFFIASCTAIIIVLRAYLGFAARRDRSKMIISASCVSTLIIIFAMNVSGDNQNGIMGVIFFVALTLPLMTSNRAAAQPNTSAARPFISVPHRSATLTGQHLKVPRY